MHRDARRDAQAGALWPELEAPAPTPSPASAPDDPFAGLLETDEANEVLVAPRDDAAAVRDLFGPVAPRAAPAPAVRPGNWPTHNYGPAYESVRAQRRPLRRRALHERHEADLWDVDDALTPPPAAALPAPPVEAEAFAPWPERPMVEVRSWLDALTPEQAQTTEAHLVSTLRGERPRPVPLDLFDVTDVLHARPRLVRQASRAVRSADWTERILRLAALGFLALFAAVLLQMLLV